MSKELNLLSESICDAAESSGRKVRKHHDGALAIETPSRTLNLTRPQTDALRAFLLAVN
jgi:hypothetical protein